MGETCLATDRSAGSGTGSPYMVKSPEEKSAGNAWETGGAAKRVLILGSGFGGAYTLRDLIGLLGPHDKLQITMVSEDNYFLFSPLLHEVAMGVVETRHIAYPIRKYGFRDKFNFVRARVDKVDLGYRRVFTSAGALDFDYLVLALGSVADMSGIRSPQGNLFALKTLRDARELRNRIIEVFEKAVAEPNPEKRRQLLTFVVSGGGYTGVQVAAEFRDFVFKYLTRYYRDIPLRDIRIILVEADQTILEGMHPKLRKYAAEQLRRMGVEVMLNSRVTRIWDDHVEINASDILPASTAVWVTGVVSNSVIAAIDAPTDSIGRVVVDEHLQVLGASGVYAVGDCAHFKDPVSGHGIPARAHTTVRQAKVAAYNILAESRNRPRKSYRYSQSGEIVSLGSSKAVFRFHGIRLYGFVARFIWIVAYGSLAMGAANRVRIMMDWLLSLIFGRDITLLQLSQESDMAPSHPPQEMAEAGPAGRSAASK